MTTFHFSETTLNSKTGPIGAITISSNSCPSACAFYKKGCYAKTGFVRFVWGKAEICKKLASLISDINKSQNPSNLIRYAVAGDLVGYGNRISRKLANILFTSINKRQTIFGYTHKPVVKGQKTINGKLVSSKIIENNIEAIKQINALPNICFNLSANSLDHADQLANLKIAPVVAVLPHDYNKPTAYTPQGKKIIVCPAQRKPNVTCLQCKLCTRKNRDSIVGFLAHGISKHVVNKIITSLK